MKTILTVPGKLGRACILEICDFHAPKHKRKIRNFPYSLVNPGAEELNVCEGQTEKGCNYQQVRGSLG